MKANFCREALSNQAFAQLACPKDMRASLAGSVTVGRRRNPQRSGWFRAATSIVRGTDEDQRVESTLRSDGRSIDARDGRCRPPDPRRAQTATRDAGPVDRAAVYRRRRDDRIWNGVIAPLDLAQSAGGASRNSQRNRRKSVGSSKRRMHAVAPPYIFMRRHSDTDCIVHRSGCLRPRRHPPREISRSLRLNRGVALSDFICLFIQTARGRDIRIDAARIISGRNRWADLFGRFAVTGRNALVALVVVAVRRARFDLGGAFPGILFGV